MEEYTVQQGVAPFKVSSIEKPCSTFYRIVGDLESGLPPVIVLHGGPGSGHEYLTPFAKLWQQYGLPVVFYDQIGCASSTHLRYKVGDHTFWRVSLFVAELDNLLEYLGVASYYILGHSWGGILAAEFASRQPKGLLRLILASASADSRLMLKGLWERARELSPEAQRAIEKAVEDGNFTSPEYLNALDTFDRMFLCRSDPFPPKELEVDMGHQAEDHTVRVSMTGPSPWVRNGSLKDHSSIPLLPQINVPTLVYNGEFDTTQYEPTVPFFNNIPRVRWISLSNASHMAHLDSLEMQGKVLKLVGGFFTQQA